MRDKAPLAMILTMVFLITGNLVGAGTLGLPTKTGLAGLFPSILGIFLVGMSLSFTANVLAHEATEKRDPTFNYPSLYQHYLGHIGKWIAIITNLLILYGLLTVFLAGATTIIINLLHPGVHRHVVMITFFIILTGLNASNMTIIGKYNSLLVMMMLICFAAMFGMSEKHVTFSHFKFTDWVFLPATIPIITTTFNFHTIIPIICDNLKWDLATVRKTIFAAVLLGCLVSILWIQVGIGVLPIGGADNSIYTAFTNNLPATVPLSKTITNPLFITVTMVFALLAIATSYIANGQGLMAFLDDLMVNQLKVVKKPNKLLLVALAFFPPLIITLIYPDIFLSALDIVGGFGVVVLFGILPCTIYLLKSRSLIKRVFGVIMLLLFICFFLLELGHEMGLMVIKPDVESWKYNFTHR